MSSTAFGPKDYQSLEVFTFDFVNLLAETDPIPTISSAVVTVERVSGPADANPSAMLDGAVGILSSKVSQRLTGGVVGTAYHVRCKATLSDAQVLTIGSDLAVRKF